ncbi:MAG: anaerobic ribonucleoside-triphosphate reductase activating protein [Spirochaetaceae bacterium]
MKIKLGGFIPTTLLDYPGEIASVLFLPGCNLKCPYCHNPSIVNPLNDTLDNIDIILEAIDKRKHLISGVVISGGEPTLYQDLNEYITYFQNLGLKVKLDTNGTNPDLLKKLKPNYIAMDLKTSLEKYVAIGYKGSSEIKESLDWIKNSGIDYEIRTTAAPIIFTKDDLKQMLPLLKDVKNYYITNFRNSETLVPAYNLNTPYSDYELEEFVKICKDAGINCTLR